MTYPADTVALCGFFYVPHTIGQLGESLLYIPETERTPVLTFTYVYTLIFDQHRYFIEGRKRRYAIDQLRKVSPDIPLHAFLIMLSLLPTIEYGTMAAKTYGTCGK